MQLAKGIGNFADELSQLYKLDIGCLGVFDFEDLFGE
jgi:hypothetical protein